MYAIFFRSYSNIDHPSFDIRFLHKIIPNHYIHRINEYYSLNIINYLFSFLFLSVWWQCQLPQSCQGWKPGKSPGVSQGQYRHQYLQRCKTHSSFFSTIHTCHNSIKMNRADTSLFFNNLMTSNNESGFLSPVHLWHIFPCLFLFKH